ncbi:H-type small acid-soluble spore protein [Metabacillus fastidiosus]|uniref:H-type small acid-soluble spore protein n=1 Tax=Metabacillus fastidiosus TaxID=1458 RepID=UPI002E21A427|nr:H-type small acid-soluble spore protein [Metabacillus fastidiosus]
MNVRRAKEISQQSEIVDVYYNNETILIQNVNEADGTARIYSRNNRENELTVPVSSLIEK